MPTVRRWCLAVVLALALGSCGGGGGATPDALIGQDVTFNAPVSPGSGQLIALHGIERGSGSVGVVLAHMLGSSQSAWSPIVGDIVDKGFHVLTFDFRGHGASGGSGRDPSHADLDLAAAVAKLRSLGATRILIVGASMGGTAAIKVAATENLAGVVSISGPAKIDALDAAAAAPKLREPVLFIVGRGDDVRYTDAARTLYAAAPQPKILEVIDGTSAHGTDLLSEPKVSSRVKKLILDFLISHRG